LLIFGREPPWPEQLFQPGAGISGTVRSRPVHRDSPVGAGERDTLGS